MERVHDDVLWRILQWLLPLEACAARAVAYRFKTVVDAVPQHEWRRIFHERVCDCLNVGDAFDWRRAGCLASSRDGIKAFCLWNYKFVFLMSPWTHPHATLESPLKSGVRREPICDVTELSILFTTTHSDLEGWRRLAYDATRAQCAQTVVQTPKDGAKTCNTATF